MGLGTVSSCTPPTGSCGVTRLRAVDLSCTHGGTLLTHPSLRPTPLGSILPSRSATVPAPLRSVREGVPKDPRVSGSLCGGRRWSPRPVIVPHTPCLTVRPFLVVRVLPEAPTHPQTVTTAGPSTLGPRVVAHHPTDLPPSLELPVDHRVVGDVLRDPDERGSILPLWDRPVRTSHNPRERPPVTGPGSSFGPRRMSQTLGRG